jgi:hypothetical protein
LQSPVRLAPPQHTARPSLPSIRALCFSPGGLPGFTLFVPPGLAL